MSERVNESERVEEGASAQLPCPQVYWGRERTLTHSLTLSLSLSPSLPPFPLSHPPSPSSQCFVISLLCAIFYERDQAHWVMAHTLPPLPSTPPRSAL